MNQCNGYMNSELSVYIISLYIMTINEIGKVYSAGLVIVERGTEQLEKKNNIWLQFG